MIPKQIIPNIFIDLSIKTTFEDLKHLIIERKDFLDSKIKQMCFIFAGQQIKDVHSPLTNIMKKKDCLTMTLLPIGRPTSKAAKINELEKKKDEAKKDEAAKINELEKKKDEAKKDEAAKINELDKKDDDDKRKNFSDIFGYVDKKSMDIILNHVENELGAVAVDGKLLCCYVTSFI